MNVHRSIWLALPLALLLPIGCADNGTGQAAEAVAGAPAEVAALSPAGHGHRHGHHGRGAAGMLFHAARQLDLAQAQRATIDGLAHQLRGGGARAEHQAMHAALVEGVRAGAVDPSRLAPLQASADAARKAHGEREAAALNGLWAALQPAQRNDVVASVRARQAERAARWSGQHAEGQSAGGWQQHRLAHLTSQLGLDAAQQQTVKGLLASEPQPTPAAMQSKHEAMKARTEALLTAFVADTFDARQLDLTPPEAQMGRGQHRAQFLAQLTPILRADQRETLAASMEKGRE